MNWSSKKTKKGHFMFLLATKGISLSTIVLNSRDWSEITWLPEIPCFKINLAISFIQKNPAGMHWLGYNDAVSS